MSVHSAQKAARTDEPNRGGVNSRQGGQPLAAVVMTLVKKEPATKGIVIGSRYTFTETEHRRGHQG